MSFVSRCFAMFINIYFLQVCTLVSPFILQRLLFWFAHIFKKAFFGHEISWVIYKMEVLCTDCQYLIKNFSFLGELISLNRYSTVKNIKTMVSVNARILNTVGYCLSSSNSGRVCSINIVVDINTMVRETNPNS